MQITPPWFVLPDPHKNCEPVIILGAGLAGCHTAYELATRNVKVVLLDANRNIAGGASANPVGIVKPFITRDTDFASQFYIEAFNFLLDRLDTNHALREQSAFNACGVLQVVDKTYPNNPIYQTCTSAQASKIAGTFIDNEAIYFARGGHLNPQAMCKFVVNHPNIEVMLNTSVTKVTCNNSIWSLTTEPTIRDLNNTDKTLTCNTLILANGESLNHFEQTQALPITSARGQTSGFKTTTPNTLKTAVTGKHYAIPINDTVLVGATFKRDDNNKTPQRADHDKNFIGLQKLLPSLETKSNSVSEFCGIRATTPDRLPIVGPVPNFAAYNQNYELIKHGLPENQYPNATYQDNLFTIGGFGSRGIVSAPYCAMLLAEQLCKTTQSIADPSSQNKLASPHELENWLSLLHPGRFAIRALKRGHPLVYSEAL